jgi:hypothetical protein
MVSTRFIWWAWLTMRISVIMLPSEWFVMLARPSRAYTQSRAAWRLQNKRTFRDCKAIGNARRVVVGGTYLSAGVALLADIHFSYSCVRAKGKQR